MTFDENTLNSLLRYCLALTADRDAAYELVQDTVERALKKPNLVKTPKAYLKKIARNRFYDLEKRRQKQHFDVLEDLDTLVDEESNLEKLAVDEKTLAAVWALLNAVEREVVFLWAVDGLSAADIAVELNIPRATVLSRLRRLRLKLNSDAHQQAGGVGHE